jgi:hypothetical protein
VTQQVAISRGINIVLNRAQILGTTSDFDLTPVVVDDLNKVLVGVVIPPAGVSPVAAQSQSGGAAPAAGAQPAGQAQPAQGAQTPPAAAKPPAKPTAPATQQRR